MPRLRDLLEKLLERRDLTEAESQELLRELTNPETPPAMSGAVLAALRSKGVVADELRGFARLMRSLARRPEIPANVRAIDIVGTGGDASGSVNISTGTSLLTASCGLPVIKHGNRSVSSRAGAADVLEVAGAEDSAGREGGGCVLPGDELHVPVRAVFSSGDEVGGAGACGDGRAHGVQHSGAARESRAAAVACDWRVQPRCREADGAYAGGPRDRAHVRDSRRRGVG